MSSIPGAPAANKTTATAQTGASHAAIGPGAEYTPLTPDLLLFFCQARLKTMDRAIADKMAGQNTFVALQGDIANIQTTLKSLQKQGGGDNEVAFNDPDKVNELNGQLGSAIDHARQTGDNKLVATLEKVKVMLNAGDTPHGDSVVLNGEIKDMNTQLDTVNATCRSGAEVSMIELQSLVSQRSTALQLTTGMMNSINEGTKSIAANIGRG